MLTGNSLRYYKDAKAEETNTLDGRIDLSGCYDITEVNVGRNYGFRIKVGEVGNLRASLMFVFEKHERLKPFVEIY